MAEQGCLLSSCAGNPGAEGSNPSLSAARPRSDATRGLARRPMTARFRFRLGGVEIEGPFEVSEALHRNAVAAAGANRPEVSLDDGVHRTPEFGGASVFAGSRREARPGLGCVC